MSVGVLINLSILSATLALGQWLFFKLFNVAKVGFIPLFGSLLLTNVAIIFIKGMVR